MQILDEEGNLFGVINVIDAFVLLLVVAVVVSGIAFVLNSGNEAAAPTPTYAETSVIFRASEQPDFVVEAIETGPVDAEDVVSVDGMTIQGNLTAPRSDSTAYLEVTLRPRQTETGDVTDIR